MEHLSREDCALLKAIGYPQEADWWWHKVNGSWRCERFAIVQNYDAVLACPHWGDVLEWLQKKVQADFPGAYIESRISNKGSFIALCAKTTTWIVGGIQRSSPVEAVSALLKAVAEREKVDALS